MKTPFRAAIFDLDGTLIDSYAAIHASLCAVLQAFERPPVSLAECRRMVGHGLDTLIARAIGLEDVDRGVKLFRESYRVLGPLQTTLLDGADAVTRRLRARGVPLAIASNKPSYFSRQLLDGLGIADRFAAIAGPDRGFPPKPAPAMVFDVLGVMGVSAAESLFVGDMEVDVETARAAGMAVAVLPTGSCTRQELAEARPDYLLASLDEVLGLF